MRPPRYRFPDEVRTTTRDMASRMIDDGEIAETPEQLDAWIAQRPEFREPLERGGYGTEFDAHDLYPLLQAMVLRAGGPAPAVEAPPRSSTNRWLIALLVALVFVILLVFLLVGG